MNNRTLTLGIATILSASLFAFQHEGHSPDQPVPAKTVKGVQTLAVAVADGKYTPAFISLRKGVPVALSFKGGRNMGCGATIEFKSLNQKQSVKEGQTVTFRFTPKKSGVISFACPMGMYRGKLMIR